MAETAAAAADFPNIHCAVPHGSFVRPSVRPFPQQLDPIQIKKKEGRRFEIRKKDETTSCFIKSQTHTSYSLSLSPLRVTPAAVDEEALLVVSSSSSTHNPAWAHPATQ